MVNLLKKVTLKDFMLLVKKYTFAGLIDDKILVGNLKNVEEQLDYNGCIYVITENSSLDYAGLEMYDLTSKEVCSIVFLQDITNEYESYWNLDTFEKFEFLDSWNYGDSHDVKKLDI
jgi:hypothetical protein